MKKQYHVLNGDALKDQFPEEISGEIIVCRECLVDGSVSGNNLDELFETRAWFISQNYGHFEREDYFEKTVTEFKKTAEIPAAAEINLWFEDDLFCQVNLWFITYLLSQYQKNNALFLIRPQVHTRFGFGGLSKGELVSLFANKIPLQNAESIANLWTLFQSREGDALLDAALHLEADYPFMIPAVRAYLESLPADGLPGRPHRTLGQIMDDLNTTEFGPVFQEFSKREVIYGFGDIQVKRLYDQIISSRTDS